MPVVVIVFVVENVLLNQFAKFVFLVRVPTVLSCCEIRHFFGGRVPTNLLEDVVR